MRSYQHAVEYLYRLQWFGQKLGLETIGKVLARLGNPQNNFRSVHIAGTNGKGSTAAMVAEILKAEGTRVGLYTSPHLVDFSERVRVNGIPVSQEAVTRLTDGIARDAAAGTEITFFEFTTALAFAHFSECAVEVAVIETGLGGRLDATNIIRPEVSVLTNIGLDHQEYLGETLGQIAREKAGIIKPGIPAVTGADQEEVLGIFSEISREMRSSLYALGREFFVQGDSPEDFEYRGIRHLWPSLSLGLNGRHQLRNAACALAAMEVLADRGFGVSEASIREGLRAVRWEGRLEALESPGEPLFLLDGAHNAAGAEALGEFLRDHLKKRPGRLILVLGILRDKDIPALMKKLIPLAGSVILTQPRYHRALSVAELAMHARRMGIEPRLSESVEEGLRLAKSTAGPKDTVCVTGSLFTVGEARAFLKGMEVPSPLKG